MAGLNQCSFIGNLGADPEVRSLQSGSKVVNLRLAVSETWKDKQSGERKEKTEWVSIVIFGDGLANVAERYLRKGSKIYASGKLATRKWQDKDGNDRYSTEVVLQGPGDVLTMLDAPSRGEGLNAGGQRMQGGANRGNDGLDNNDHIPF